MNVYEKVFLTCWICAFSSVCSIKLLAEMYGEEVHAMIKRAQVIILIASVVIGAGAVLLGIWA